MMTNIDSVDARLLDIIQTQFPVIPKPFEYIGNMLSITADEVTARISRLKADGVVRQINAIFDSTALGYRSALIAFRVDEDMLDSVASNVAMHQSVTHCYSRDAAYNLWFTITADAESDIDREAALLARIEGVQSNIVLPALRIYKIGVFFKMDDSSDIGSQLFSTVMPTKACELSAEDRAAVRALQTDLPLTHRPFAELAAVINISEEELISRAKAFIENGIMRRYAAVLRHKRAGYSANAMVCWKVGPEKVDEIGQLFARNAGISHCYERPISPDWPYSLYTMVHAHTDAELMLIINNLALSSGISEYTILRTIKEYKKSRVLYFV